MTNKEFVKRMKKTPDKWGIQEKDNVQKNVGLILVYHNGVFVKSYQYRNYNDKKQKVAMAFRYCKNRKNCYLETKTYLY